MNSTIPLRNFVPDLDPTQYKLHCAVWNGEAHPLDVYARSWDEWVGWNRYRPGTNAFNRPFILSLIQIPDEEHRWLFGGAFAVLERGTQPHSHAYKVRLREDTLPGCIGRLKVRYHLRSRTNRLRLESAIDELQVAELLPGPYSGAPFPGHDSINIRLQDLADVYAQQRPDWRIALEQMKGVYVIHDRTSGKPYVGSAYGDTGIWARWGQYVASLHGGNIDLRALIDREGQAYARENLTFALLEFWSMRTSDEHVIEREQYWKDVMLTREFGHNKN